MFDFNKNFGKIITFITNNKTITNEQKLIAKATIMAIHYIDRL